MKSPGTAGHALVNEIAGWSEEELDRRIAEAFAKATQKDDES